MQSFPRRVDRTLARCGVCGFSEVRTDEVVDRGMILLAECPRCEHRWTERVVPQAPAMRPVASRRSDRGEVATAA